MNEQLNLKALENLSPQEKAYALKILHELSENGTSKMYEDLLMSDYKEVPVDIETFITDDQYLGKAWKDASGNLKMYPFWMEQLKKLFPNNIDTDYTTLLESGARGIGKAQPLDSLVLTENGYIRMGDIKVGDLVYGENGELHKVIGVFPQGKKSVYKVIFNDSTNTLCCDQHLWTVKRSNDKSWKTFELKDIPYNEDRYFIPTCLPVEFKSNELPTSGYDIGIKCADEIPKEYLFSDLYSRKRLFQGLSESNKILLFAGNYYINESIDNRLKSDITTLIQSLGGIVVKNNIIFPQKDELCRYITNVEYVDNLECQCILLDSESHLYLTNDFIVTHNSEIACGAVGTYLLYRVMCLKNPLQFYHLKLTEKICFAFMNIKKELSEEIATSKFQNTIQMSPWFMSRGKMTQRNNKPYWTPPDPIKIIIGSQSDDVIGQPIYFCLDGETPIFTSDGCFSLQELVDKQIRVPTVNQNGDIEYSEVCTVKPTVKTQDYIEIELDDGSVIKCTPEHRLMLKDGTYKEAQHLTQNDELLDKQYKM